MRERNTPYATRDSQFPIRSGVALVATSIDTVANIIYIISICIRISRKIYARETTRIAVVASINCFFFHEYHENRAIYTSSSIYIWSFPRRWATAGTMCSTNYSQEFLVKPSKNGMVDEKSYILRQQQVDYVIILFSLLLYWLAHSRKYNINIIIRYTRLFDMQSMIWYFIIIYW